MDKDKQTVIDKICKLTGEALSETDFLSPEDLRPTRTNNHISATVDLGTHRSQDLRGSVRHMASEQAAEFIQLVPVEEHRKTVRIDFLSVEEIGRKAGEDFHRVGAIPDAICNAIKQIGSMASTEAVLQILRQKKIPKNVRRAVFPTKELAKIDYLCFFVLEQRGDGPGLEVTTDSEAWAPEVLVAVVLKDPPNNGQATDSPTRAPSPDILQKLAGLY